jgi:hypothetical protein
MKKENYDFFGGIVSRPSSSPAPRVFWEIERYPYTPTIIFRRFPKPPLGTRQPTNTTLIGSRTPNMSGMGRTTGRLRDREGRK